MSAAKPNAALDARGVLWLLGSMLFVVAPHLTRMPEWVAAFFVLMVGWRGWVALTARRFPARWVILLLTVGAVAGTFVQFGRLFGRDAGTALLVLMAALKLVEMRTSREVLLSIHLGFVLVMTNFLYSQTIPMGLYMLACVWLFVATLVGYQRGAGGRAPTVAERLVPAGRLLAQAVPLMLVLFFLFPRVAGPLWALPQDARAGVSGLSDTMTPGNISKLIQSEATAFRVEFEGEVPSYQGLYFRGPVLWAFDGRSWRMSEFSPAASIDYPKAERPVKYAVTLEPHGKHWLFALDVPGSLPPGVGLRHDLQLRSVRPVDARVRYEMTSYLDYRFGEKLPQGFREYALRFDERQNPRTIALGRQWAAENPDPRRVIGRALQHFNAQFTYTLEPPLLESADPYDEFLFDKKRGFCEHYAGAFALLMRAAGIPSRVVTGYQGGEVNPLNRELIVRQADAHAWVEVWLEGEGWVRIDPTSAVSPLRIDGGINAALGPIGVIPSLIAADRLGVLASVRFAWDALNSQWNQWVLGYNMDRQRQFLSRLGIDAFDWMNLATWLAALAFVVAGLVSLALVIRDLPRREPPAVRAWRRYGEKLAKAGLARRPHEGPLDYLARVKASRPDLADEAEAITARYVEARYGEGLAPAQARELARLVRDFRAA